MSTKPSAVQTPKKSGATTPKKSGRNTPTPGNAQCGRFCRFCHSKLFLVLVVVLNVLLALGTALAVKKDFKFKRILIGIVAVFSAVSIFFLFKILKSQAKTKAE